jgi:hypothetical protein
MIILIIESSIMGGLLVPILKMFSFFFKVDFDGLNIGPYVKINKIFKNKTESSIINMFSDQFYCCLMSKIVNLKKKKMPW